MDFQLNEEQQMLQDTVARLVRGEYSLKNVWSSARPKPATAKPFGPS